MAKWLAKEFDWDTKRYTGRYYDIAEAGVVAVFVDSFYGDDASADPEDPDLPLKTLGAAITYLNTNGANDSRIFMNGIFSETLTAQTYWYRFIGCGGGANGRTIFYNITLNRTSQRIENILTIGYSGGRFTHSATAINTFHYLLNCLIQNCAVHGHSNASYVNSIVSYYSVFKNISQTTPGAISISHFLGNNNIYIDLIQTTRIYIQGVGNYINDTSNVYDQSFPASNLYDINAQFINTDNNDYNVRITSPLIGTGAIDEISGDPTNIAGVKLGIPYNGLIFEFTTAGGATVTDLTIDATGKYTITAPATSGTLETALLDLGNIYPLENIDLFNVFDFLSGEITQGVYENFSSPRMALTIKLKYGLTSAEVDDCPWLLIEYGKQPTFSGTGANRVGNADDTFDPDTFQTITCRYMKLFITLQNNS